MGTGKVKGKYPQEYLDSVKVRMMAMDTQGKKDKVTVTDAYNGLNVTIGELLTDQNEKDAAKIKDASKDLMKVLEKYAGKDKEFDVVEWADFLNGKENLKILETYQSTDKHIKNEMQWIDEANVKDGKVTKDDIISGIRNHFEYIKKFGVGISSENLKKREDIITKKAGPDGVFTFDEYKDLRNNETYQSLLKDYGVVPWFDPSNPEEE